MIDIIIGLLVVLYVWCETAPYGYQDETNFHYGAKKKD